MKETKNQFPTEEVTLPSKGLLYPEDSPLRSGIIEMKYMTAKEEDILTNQNYVKQGTVVDKLLKSLIIDGKNEFHFTLPTSKKEVTFKFLTHSDEQKIARELKGLKKLNDYKRKASF